MRRLLAAARAERDAGALEEALELLTAAEAGPMSALQAAEAEQLRGRVAFDQRRLGDAARRLVGAAKRLEPLDPALARATHLEALGAAIWAGHLGTPGGLAEAGEAARAAPPAPDPPEDDFGFADAGSALSAEERPDRRRGAHRQGA